MPDKPSPRWDALHRLFWFYGGISEAEFQRTVGVSRKTLRRWRLGQHRIPEAAVLSAHFIAGDLGRLFPGWQDWRLDRKTGDLIDPEGNRHTTGTIRCWWWTWQQLSELRSRENQFRASGGTLAPGLTAHAITEAMHQRLQGDPRHD